MSLFKNLTDLFTYLLSCHNETSIAAYQQHDY